MANTLLTHSMIADRALFDLSNNLIMGQKVFRGYESEFGTPVGGYKKGASVTIHLPNKFRAKVGATIDKVDVEEPSTTVTVDVQNHVAMDFSETDMTLSVEEFSRKYINPATIALANLVDVNGLLEYKNIYNSKGTPGTTPATFGVLANVAERFTNESVPLNDRCAIWTPKAKWALADGELKSVFNPSIVERMLRRGFSGYYADMEHYEDQNVASHTVGTWDAGSTGVMNGATAEKATSLVTNGWAASTVILQKGDVFTIAGVYGVNPVSGIVWEGNQLRQFVATSQVTSDGAGAATIPISPTIISAAANEEDLPYQTVATLPANGAALTVMGSDATGYSQNLAFHRDCFALTMVPFKRPRSADKSVMWAQASDKQMGLSITVATAFDLDSYYEATRLDILYGWDTPRPNLGCRIWG